MTDLFVRHVDSQSHSAVTISPSAVLCALFASVLITTGVFAVQSELKSKQLDSPAVIRSFVDNGVAIEYTMTQLNVEDRHRPLRDGDNVRISFSVRDELSDEPIRGLHPMAWIDPRSSRTEPGPLETRDRIAGYLSGLLSYQADLDLNAFTLWTINHDRTISVINPLISFSRTQLLALIELSHRGDDLVLSPDQTRLFVSMPDLPGVAVIDTSVRKLLTTIPIPTSGKPRRLLVQPDGRMLWVGLDDTASVIAIDTANLEIIDTITVGEGLHDLAWNPDRSVLCVTNSKSNTTTLIDGRSRMMLEHIRVGHTPVSVAYGSAAEVFVIGSLNDEHLTVVDTITRTVVAQIPTSRGVVEVAIEPNGRFGFAVNQLEDHVEVFDTSTNSILQVVPTVAAPDQIRFTEAYAYVRSTKEASVSIIDMTKIGSDPLSAVDILAGRLPPDARPEDISVAPMIAVTPELNTVMIANGPDAIIHYYVEGMMAPMGTFKNYNRRPVGVTILDRSLLETAPGVYSTDVRLPSSGMQDVFFVIDQPRVVRHLQFNVDQNPDGQHRELEASITVELDSPNKLILTDQANHAHQIILRIQDANTGSPVNNLDDVRVLVIRQTGRWQTRLSAQAIGDGMYVIEPQFPARGVYSIVLWIESRGLHYGNSPNFKVRVVNESRKDTSP